MQNRSKSQIILFMCFLLSLFAFTIFSASYYVGYLLPEKRCDEAKKAIYSVDPNFSWKISCEKEIPYPVDSYDNVAVGLYVSQEKTIFLKKGIKNLNSVAIHELGHYYADNKLTLRERTTISRDLGFDEFYEGPYSERPTEQWARSFAYCLGYSKDELYESQITCNTIQKYAPELFKSK